MRCTRCKKQLKKGAKFCTYCGTKVVKKKGKRIVSFLLAILLLLSMGTIGLSVYFFIPENFSVPKALANLFSVRPTVKINNAEEAIAHAKELGKEFGYENAMSEMTEKVTTEIDGDCYYRLQQNYQGIPVYGRNVIYVAGEEGNVVSVTGNPQDTVIEGDLIPSVTRDQVSDAIKKYQKEVLGFDDSIDTEIEALNEYDLNIYNCDGNGYLVYRICVNGYEFLVDAHSAEIWFSNCLIRFATVNGNLQGQTQIYKDLHYTETNNAFSLEDPSKGISVYTANNQFQFWKFWSPKWVQVGKNLVTWRHGESADPSAVDAYANVQLTYDYFNSVLHNKSIDGKGEKQIRVITGVLDLHDNACYSPGEEVINIGKAKNYRYDKSAHIDWIAHEYMHGVEYNHSGMYYSGESGAVMEGLSDIFGELVESWSKKQNPNWVFTETQRNMISPGSTGYPSSYHDSNWANTEELNDDHGGVHTNNTVITHAAYLMWNGGVNYNAAKKLNEDQLAKLWYRAMLMMPADCNFVECRTLLELAASSMNLTDSQMKCVSEAFDAVGIVNTENRIVDYELAPNCKLQVIGKDEKPYDDYTVTVTHYDMVGSYAKGQPLFVYRPQQNVTSTKVTSSAPSSLPSEKGVYKISISDNQHPANKTEFLIQVDPKFTKETLTVYTEFEQPLVVNLTPSTNANVYNVYKEAARNTTASGKWNESMSLTASMAISNGSAKTKTKMTMTSDAYVSGYSETDLSKLFMSGSAEMSVMGQTYAWNMRYEDGIAHYKYTQPNQTSADMAIDPGFFNFGTITSDMMTNAKISGNQITFTVPGDKITEVGIAAVNQMSGVDDLKYGDVDVTVVIGQEGTIETVAMKFHASLQYQGYDAEVDYNIAYRFSSGSSASGTPSVSISPCSYTNEDNKYDILTLHEVNGNEIVFSIWWYRTWDLNHVTATLNGNVASFDFTDENLPGTWAKGTIEFTEGRAVFRISQCSYSLLNNRSWDFVFLAEALSEQQLKEIGRFLRVPDDLPVTYKQGMPYYWEAVGIYCTEVGIYHDGALIAGGDVNPLTGAVAGGIYMYSG